MHLIGTNIGNKEKKLSVRVVMMTNIKIRNNWLYFSKTFLADEELFFFLKQKSLF